MSNAADPRVGMMRCTRTGCGGVLGQSGQEVFRMICGQCGQNYFVRLVLEPVEPKQNTQPNILPVGRAE
jgi:predicted  nucleic acid-binding Zn-ribbon protein